ncbi:MAG TPA: alanine racemase [Gaiellaceae bacterium]|nr:alanine racemase [Gaiellaceae bacterium]
MTELDLETPAPVVDLDRLERNLSRWQERCDELGLASRPHVKTHKCTEIARRQVELGAAGLTCQTLGEAETMIDAGLDDLLVATFVLGERKLAHLADLLERAAVTVVTDDARVLQGLDRAAASAGRELRVLVECDTGLGRTGVADPEAAAALAAAVAGFGSLRFAGFLTYPSPPGATAFLARAVELAQRAGLEVETVSAGGTPAMWAAAELLPTVTEYRAGTYAFHDRATVAAGAATPDDVALTVCATVVSRPARDRAILDAGSKALSSDLSAENGFGLVLEAPHSTLVKLNEEHGYLELADGDELELGQQVRIVPNHACVVANLFAELALVRDGALIGSWPVDARGR